MKNKITPKTIFELIPLFQEMEITGTTKLTQVILKNEDGELALWEQNGNYMPFGGHLDQWDND